MKRIIIASIIALLLAGTILLPWDGASLLCFGLLVMLAGPCIGELSDWLRDKFNVHEDAWRTGCYLLFNASFVAFLVWLLFFCK